jgi:hypothetical protein
LSADDCRAKAAECAALAEIARDTPIRRLYEQLALHWLEMASYIAGWRGAAFRDPVHRPAAPRATPAARNGSKHG